MILDSWFYGKKSVVGTPSNLGLILEHITILNEVRILSINLKWLKSKFLEKSQLFLPNSPTICCNFYSDQRPLTSTTLWISYIVYSKTANRVKAKPVAKQGRKTAGLLETAGLPLLG